MSHLNETGVRPHQNIKPPEIRDPSAWVTRKNKPQVSHATCKSGDHTVVSVQHITNGNDDNVTVTRRQNQIKSWLPFPSRGVPESVNKVLMIFSKLQLGSMFSGSSAKCFSISRRTSSKEVAVSSRMMLALAKNPSKSRWALTSSSKFFNFRYCVRKIRGLDSCTQHPTAKV